MSVDPQTAEWLDGPRLVEWVRENGPEHVSYHLNGRTERALGRWRNGGRADVYLVDIVLTQLGLHLSELPDDLWLEPSVFNRPSIVRGVAA